MSLTAGNDNQSSVERKVEAADSARFHDLWQISALQCRRKYAVRRAATNSARLWQVPSMKIGRSAFWAQ